MQQVYSLGFRIEDLVEEPASLRAREAPLPRPFDDGALGGNVTAASGVACFHITRKFACCRSRALFAMSEVQVSALITHQGHLVYGETM
jgi:hypothetical protein